MRRKKHRSTQINAGMLPAAACVRHAQCARRGGLPSLAHLSLVSIGLLVLAGCNLTKNVGENEYLLDKVEIEAVGLPPDMPKSELRRYVRQHPNGRVMGRRFHLWLYNLGKKGKDTGFSGWLHRIGEPPVIYSESLTAQSVSNLETYLHSRGFYSANVRDSSYSRRKKRMRVRYSVDLGVPTMIDTVSLSIEDSIVRRFVTQSDQPIGITAGVRLDNQILDAERRRIETLLRDEGFYNFTSESVSFIADTLGHPYRAKIALTIPPPGDRDRLKNAFRRYVVDSVRIFSMYDPMRTGSSMRDSLRHTEENGLHYYYPQKPGIRLPVIEHMILFRQDSLLRLSQVNKSQNNLLGLGLYQSASFDFRESQRPPDDSLAEEGPPRLYPINADIRLMRFPVQGYSLEALLTTSGELGMEGSFTYRHRNLFRGSELLDIRLQAQVDAIRRRSTFKFRTAVELGARMGITFPRFLIPCIGNEFVSRNSFLIPCIGNEFVSRNSPTTRLELSYNYQRRPDYTRTLAASNISYTWNGAFNTTHSIVPAEINVVKISRIDDAFAERISRTYLAHSYIDQIVTLSSYSFTFSEQASQQRPNTSSVRVNMELSGNTYWGLSKWFAKPDDEGVYTVLGLPYSQYVRADVNYVYRISLDKSNVMVLRFFAGAGYPYGNSKALPFSKKYYQGGANGVRAWHARDLGPGSYYEEDLYFPNQTGDIKLEMNWEYRFKLFWKFESAVFVDTGNIWAITDDDEREGAVWEWNRAYREMALGYGTGLRLNLGFFIIRADLGIKLYDPTRVSDEGGKGVWIPTEQEYTNSDFVLHFGVGYPF